MSNSAHSDCDVSGGFEANGLIANQNGSFHYSSCAVARAWESTGMGGLKKLTSRAFGEELR